MMHLSFPKHVWIYCTGPAQGTPLLLLHIIYYCSIITAICVTIIAAAVVTHCTLQYMLFL